MESPAHIDELQSKHQIYLDPTPVKLQDVPEDATEEKKRSIHKKNAKLLEKAMHEAALKRKDSVITDVITDDDGDTSKSASRCTSGNSSTSTDSNTTRSALDIINNPSEGFDFITALQENNNLRQQGHKTFHLRMNSINTTS